MRRGLAAGLVLLLPLTACGSRTVPAGEVEAAVAAHLRDTTGLEARVTCARELQARRGERVACRAGDARVVVEVVDDDGGFVVREAR